MFRRICRTIARQRMAAEDLAPCDPAPEGASNFKGLVASLKRCPDTNPEFFRSLFYGEHLMPVGHNEFRSVAHRVSDDSGSAIATLSGRPLLRNVGIPLNLDWVREVRVNTSAVLRKRLPLLGRA